MPVTPIQQLQKYELKYSGTNVTAVLTAIKSTVMEPRYEAAVILITADREIVRRILEENDVPPGRHGIHYALGFAISSAKLSHSGPVLLRTAQALKARFVALGADPVIADKIISALAGVSPYY